ncbi:MAG TPA: HlyD family efflux transporter periplasmic adaptor subunit [Steroidobacteraceae bacterium]|nr:HlyD family efflux transporter periplasmic adaptor subunit [Steroidobacteraceae bacterium]
MAQTSDSSTPPEPKSRLRRKPALIALTIVFAIALSGYLGYEYLHGRNLETTDDAYVGGNLVQLMPQIAGTVMTIHADDADYVKAGQVLVELDGADKRIALEQAEADLAQAVRDVRVMFATRAQLDAELAVRQAELDRAQSDVTRREGLTGRGLIPREELDHAKDELRSARASLQAAQETLSATKARIDGTTIENHPTVARAAARLKDAHLAVQRTTLRAPVGGHIAKRGVQVGQRVEPGAPLMAIVPLDDLWVEANFKEVQLRRMRIGQPAHITADLYGRKVEFAGEVVGLGIGTGAAFALLPAQNASGNWIKVVQRVPVRIRLSPEQLAQHPLRIGLSMRVNVDLREDGPQLAQVPRSKPAYTTISYGDDTTAAEQLIRKIVTSNVGAPERQQKTQTSNEVRDVARL